MRERLGARGSRAVAGGRRARRHRRAIRYAGLQSALYPLRRHRRPRAGGARFRSARALDGGADGLDIYRRIVAGIPTVVPDGWVVLEVGYDQADAVAACFRAVARDRPRQASRYLPRCRRNATLCCCENTELSICPESPWILARHRDRLPSSGIVHASCRCRCMLSSGWVHGPMRSRLDCSQQGDVSSAPLTAQEKH